MNEYLLSTNIYSVPSVISSPDANGVLITRLLLLEPGTNPHHPDMGVGIGPKYRFITENDLPALRSKIQDQINTYLPLESLGESTVDLEIKENTKYLLISITVGSTKYVYDTEESNTPIELSNLV